MSLANKLKKNSTISLTATLGESKVFGKKDVIPTPVPMLNVALSGSVDGGLTAGLTVIAGPSKHFKSMFTILMAAAYLKRNPDGYILFYDNEFGAPSAYFEKFGIPQDRIIHSPFTNIEEFKHDIMVQLEGEMGDNGKLKSEGLKRGDKVFIMVDSIGNAASKKEVDDAQKGNAAADMTRAKQIKSLFRMITPHLTLKDIPMVVVNHTYKEQGMYPKDIVGGGTGIYYSADTIWIIGRQQEKEGTSVAGYNFIINVEKSRTVKEKVAKIPITVMNKGGLGRFTGLLDEGMQSGFVIKPSNGWYSKVDPETGEVSEKKFREADLDTNADFWRDILNHPKFKQFIEEKYKLPEGDLLSKDEDAEFDRMVHSDEE